MITLMPGRLTLQGFKLVSRDSAETNALAGTQKRGRIFCRIEQAQRCPADQIPAAGGAQRIDSRLCAANADRTGGNLFSRHVTARSGQFLRKTSQKRKPWNKSYAGDAILSSAMKIDDFAWGDIRASRNIIDIECEFRIIIADGDLDPVYVRSCSCAPPAAVRALDYSNSNVRRKPIEDLGRRFSCLGNSNRVEENCDAC